MLSFTVLCIGKLKESYLRDACAEYAKRLGAFSAKLEIVELPETRVADNPSDAQIVQTIRSEGEKILSKIPADAYVTALCIEGKPCSSEQLAARIAQTAANQTGKFVFVIGGSHGLSDAVKTRADWRLSMSPMTFPHQLARVMLCEQLYRATTINAGTRYHK